MKRLKSKENLDMIEHLPMDKFKQLYYNTVNHGLAEDNYRTFSGTNLDHEVLAEKSNLCQKIYSVLKKSHGSRDLSHSAETNIYMRDAFARINLEKLRGLF